MHIVLADDHELVRAGLKPFLTELGTDVHVEEHDDVAGVLHGGAATEPADLVIVDLFMPGMEGTDSLHALVRTFSPAPVVILSASHSVENIVAAAQAGLAGYLLKTMSGPVMVAALKLVMLGERYFPATAVDSMSFESSFKPRPLSESLSGADNPLAKLSGREREILELMIEGLTNRTIAERLSLQEITVKVHLRNIYRKLGAANRTQAVRIALENGWRP